MSTNPHSHAPNSSGKPFQSVDVIITAKGKLNLACVKHQRCQIGLIFQTNHSVKLETNLKCEQSLSKQNESY